MRFVVVLLAGLVLPFIGMATKITGNNTGYAGKTLTFYSYSDPISGKTEQAFNLNFDKTGKCETTIAVNKSMFVYCDFGKYRGLLLIQPNKDLQLKFPPFREKSFAEEKNPYFHPISFWFFTENGNQLNDKISHYEQKLNELTDKNFEKLYFQQSKAAFDSLQHKLNLAFPASTPKVFKHHKNLRLKLIEADIFRYRPEEYSQIFNQIPTEFWTHKAFITLFEKTFDEQLSFSAKTIGGEKISLAVQHEDHQHLLQFISEKYKVSGKVAELVLLKLLHDAYYTKDFSHSAIKNMIADDFFTKNNNTLLKEAAFTIISKITFLEKETLAPVLCLKNLEGNVVCSNKNTNKFKYLVFADAETMVCREHLKYLARINDLFNKNLDIFVVLRNTDRKEIDRFFSETKVPGEITIDLHHKYIQEYKVRSFPQCYLLNEKHQVVFKDTKAPLDGFEQQFGNWLRQELFMRQRNQSR